MTVDLTRTSPAVCGHCGRVDVGTFPAGWGAIAGVPVCHPNESGRPDCYRLVTVFRHPLNCRCGDRYPVAGGPRSGRFGV